MKIVYALSFALCLGLTAGANLRSTVASQLRAGTAAGFNSTAATEIELVRSMLDNAGGVQKAIHHVASKMTFKEAVHRLDGKLPKDIASLLKVGKNGDVQAPSLDEESMAKARNILNDMIFNSMGELDDVIIECKEFENSNRKSFDQVKTDLARLGSEVATTDSKIGLALATLTKADSEFKSVNAQLKDAEAAYLTKHAADSQDMTVKKNDLAVFNFLMEATKCSDGEEFLQKGSKAVSLAQVNASRKAHHVQVCEDKSGGLDLRFNNKKAQLKVERGLSAKARKQLRDALGLAYSGHLKSGGAKLIQISAHKVTEEDDETTTSATASTTGMVTMTQEPIPVQEGPEEEGQWRKCTMGTPNCGLLHDTMSLQWGKFKDSVDELQADMSKSVDEWMKLKENLNEQLDVLTEQKSTANSALSDHTGEKNTLVEGRMEKDTQYHNLEVEFDEKMHQCHAKIEEIAFTDICACRTARNELLEQSTVSPPDKIDDCDVKDWVPETCSVSCDDSCPHYVGGVRDPYSCGGWMTLTRDPVVVANQYGVACPLMSRSMRCGQFKCAEDCVVSEWSGWSKCSKECEGGSRQKTRSILVKPKHGGQSCPAIVETAACNTGSCDRDCVLDSWSEWSPCSMSCDPGNMPGFQERRREVLVPMRGEGKCPEADAEGMRYEKQSCNEQACSGDEICVAQQDLILLIDSSGSLRESGFETIRDFAANLTGKYKSEYYGAGAVQMGAVLFGNGAIEEDDSISKAIVLSELTSDLASVKAKVGNSTWQKGFTNLAQAFTLAQKLLLMNGRKNAQSAVMVLSDGKYSFSFETEQMVNQLKEKAVMVFMAPIAEVEGKWAGKMKEWASQPWETNYQLLPGLQAVKHNMELFSALIVAKFCSDSISPSAEAVKDDQRGYALIHEGGFPTDACGMWVDIGDVDSQDECAQLAESTYGYLAFSITEPSEWSEGMRHCYGEAIAVTEALYEEWLVDKTDVPCPNGEWIDNPMYNVYAIAPASTSA